MRRLDGSTTLPDGTRLRLRLPRRRDHGGIRNLLHRLGLEAAELDGALRFDPTERVAVVATRLAGHTEEVVGLATMDRFAREPELVVADELEAPGTSVAMESALRAHAR